MRLGKRGWLAVALLPALIACGAHTTRVAHRMLMPASGERHETDAHELFVMPLTLSSPQPAFPEHAGVPDRGDLELVVCAEVWLSENGDVTRVAPLADAPGCAGGSDPSSAPYAASVLAALRGWEFTPAMICSFPPEALDRRARGDCTGPDVVIRRVPVRLDYAFTFSSRHGRRQVGMARRQAHADTR